MKLATQLIITGAFATSTYAFTSPGYVINTRGAIVANVPQFMSADPAPEAEAADEPKTAEEPKAAEEKPPVAQKKKPKKGPKHPDGVFSPAVRFASLVMGDETLVNIRKKTINLHTETIKNFVDTSSTEFGEAVLRTLFKFADKDGNGTIDENELAAALQSLGFSWVDEKQSSIAFKRIDKDKSGGIDLDEWMTTVPLTLRVNLIKLAVKNGGDMGLLTEPVKKGETKASKNADGVFSPAVIFAREVMGDDTIKNLRQKVINMHSEKIKGFVDTSSTEFGDAVLRTMFKFADKDGSGTIDEEELAASLKTLGFSWVDEKQTSIIFKRTDKDKSGTIDLDEWMTAAPLTLRVNLIRLAKQNGEEMGLLS